MTRGFKAFTTPKLVCLRKDFLCKREKGVYQGENCFLLARFKKTASPNNSLKMSLKNVKVVRLKMIIKIRFFEMRFKDTYFPFFLDFLGESLMKFSKESILK